MYRNYKRYNIENLTPFTSENASYYGSIGGKASGKSRLNKKIKNNQLEQSMLLFDLMDYKGRKRLSKTETEIIKRLLHMYKIYDNRIQKLLKYRDIKYGIKA